MFLRTFYSFLSLLMIYRSLIHSAKAGRRANDLILKCLWLDPGPVAEFQQVFAQITISG
jgi:hypothetical protein